MPLYDYECSKCGNIEEMIQPFERRQVLCSVCQMPSNRIVSPIRRSQVDIFQAQHFEELGDDCPFISSKQQLADECEKRGLKSRLLMEGYKEHGRRRWV